MNGWGKTGIKEAVQKGMAGLPNLDPFNDTDPITDSDAELYSQAASISKIRGAVNPFIPTAKVTTNGLKKMRILIIRSEMVLIVLMIKMKMLRQKHILYNYKIHFLLMTS